MSEKYEKMMKIGIPIGAIKHAMAKDNVCQSIVDNLLNLAEVSCSGCDYPETGRSTITNDDSRISIMNDEDNDRIQKYQKMLSLGMPRDMIRHKMIMDNASQTSITSVCGSEEKISGKKDYKSKKSGLISIYWEKISNECIDFNQGNVWSIIAKSPQELTSSCIDKNILHNMFHKPSPNIHVKKFVTSANSQKKMAQILSNNRAQIIYINLRSFREFSFDELVSIIQHIDPNHQMKEDRVSCLRGILPKQHEANAIRLQNNADDKWFTDAELFFRKLLRVPRYDIKVKVIETLALFKQNSNHIISSLRILVTTCENVIKSEKLRLILKLILSVGNIMNDGSKLGNAVGIKISSLIKVVQTKSSDRKSTVLDYIVTMLIRRDKEDILNLHGDIPFCADASRLQLNETLSDFDSLISSIEECRTEYTVMKNEQNDKTYEFSLGFDRLESFLVNSDSTITLLYKSRKETLDACRNLIVYCGEDGTGAHATTILTSLASFMNNIDEAVKKYYKTNSSKKDKCERDLNTISTPKNYEAFETSEKDIEGKSTSTTISENTPSVSIETSNRESAELHKNFSKSSQTTDSRHALLVEMLKKRANDMILPNEPHISTGGDSENSKLPDIESQPNRLFLDKEEKPSTETNYDFKDNFIPVHEDLSCTNDSIISNKAIDSQEYKDYEEGKGSQQNENVCSLPDNANVYEAQQDRQQLNVFSKSTTTCTSKSTTSCTSKSSKETHNKRFSSQNCVEEKEQSSRNKRIFRNIMNRLPKVKDKSLKKEKNKSKHQKALKKSRRRSIRESPPFVIMLKPT